MEGQVVSIHIAESDGERLEALDAARLLAGRGICDDRNFDAHPDNPEKQFTLIEEEAVAGMNSETGLKIPAEEIRRNVVTRGVRLNDLVGQTFAVGPVTVKGIELCEPCKYVADLIRDKWHIEEVSSQQIVTALVKRGGLRCEILTDGTIRPGDRIGPAAAD